MTEIHETHAMFTLPGEPVQGCRKCMTCTCHGARKLLNPCTESFRRADGSLGTAYDKKEKSNEAVAS